jgi:hypothetical protein
MCERCASVSSAKTQVATDSAKPKTDSANAAMIGKNGTQSELRNANHRPIW